MWIWSTGAMITGMRKQKYLEDNLAQCNFILKSQMNRP